MDMRFAASLIIGSALLCQSFLYIAEGFMNNPKNENKAVFMASSSKTPSIVLAYNSLLQVKSPNLCL